MHSTAYLLIVHHTLACFGKEKNKKKFKNKPMFEKHNIHVEGPKHYFAKDFVKRKLQHALHCLFFYFVLWNLFKIEFFLKKTQKDDKTNVFVHR